MSTEGIPYLGIYTPDIPPLRATTRDVLFQNNYAVEFLEGSAYYRRLGIEAHFIAFAL